MSEWSVEQRIERAQKARAVLGDEVVSEAFETARADFITAWLGTTDPQLHMAYWAQIHALEAVREALQRTVSDGQIAAEGKRRRQK